MVSLNTIFTLGVIGAGLLAFTSLGGAGGIGSRIGSSFGGGIRSFNENISSSFNAALQGLNPFAAAQESAASTLSGITEPLTELVQSPGSGGSGAGSIETSPSEYGTGSSAVDRISRYVDQPLTTVTPRQASVNVISRAKSDYGGYGSAASQNRELQSLLATNAQKYGSYFN
jgi:hypothetical protein